MENNDVIYLKNEPFVYQPGRETRWINFENPGGQKGKGALTNKGAKGHAWDFIQPGEKTELLNFTGSGVIRRIWLTIEDRSLKALKGLVLSFYWDNSQKAAVEVPLADFFGMGFGCTAIESEYFSSPEGRSFCAVFTMPFFKQAKAFLENQSEIRTRLFYEINLELMDIPTNSLYFHSFWNRESPNQLGQNYTILPEINGKGRFLGTSVNVIPDLRYSSLWWGEGEVKIYLDSDKENPTLCGTGAEDYCGTGWGLRPYTQRWQGAPFASKEDNIYSFYRLHGPDPVWFSTNIKVTIQAIGGGSKEPIQQAIKKSAPIKIVSCEKCGGVEFRGLLEKNDFQLNTDTHGDWYNFYRCDDYFSTAWFYYDKPETSLPALPELAKRIINIKTDNSSERADN